MSNGPPSGPSTMQNITCPRCTKPLIAIERFESGGTVIHSFGCDMQGQPSTTPGMNDGFVICRDCGTRTYAFSLPKPGNG